MLFLNCHGCLVSSFPSCLPLVLSQSSSLQLGSFFAIRAFEPLGFWIRGSAYPFFLLVAFGWFLGREKGTAWTAWQYPGFRIQTHFERPPHGSPPAPQCPGPAQLWHTFAFQGSRCLHSLLCWSQLQPQIASGLAVSSTGGPSLVHTSAGGRRQKTALIPRNLQQGCSQTRLKAKVLNRGLS
jgi:hypothetical protein